MTSRLLLQVFSTCGARVSLKEAQTWVSVGHKSKYSGFKYSGGELGRLLSQKGVSCAYHTPVTLLSPPCLQSHSMEGGSLGLTGQPASPTG